MEAIKRNGSPESVSAFGLRLERYDRHSPGPRSNIDHHLADTRADIDEMERHIPVIEYVIEEEVSFRLVPNTCRQQAVGRGTFGRENEPISAYNESELMLNRAEREPKSSGIHASLSFNERAEADIQQRGPQRQWAMNQVLRRFVHTLNEYLRLVDIGLSMLVKSGGLTRLGEGLVAQARIEWQLAPLTRSAPNPIGK
jgi:hypothetical protein